MVSVASLPQPVLTFVDSLLGSPQLNLAWNLLSVCDGLGGMGLGSAAKISREAVCVWLCVCLRAGPCIVRRRSKYRTGGGDGIIDSDFDPRNPGGGRTARGGVALPAVLKGLKEVRSCNE